MQIEGWLPSAHRGRRSPPGAPSGTGGSCQLSPEAAPGPASGPRARVGDRAWEGALALRGPGHPRDAQPLRMRRACGRDLAAPQSRWPRVGQGPRVPVRGGEAAGAPPAGPRVPARPSGAVPPRVPSSSVNPGAHTRPVGRCSGQGPAGDPANAATRPPLRGRPAAAAAPGRLHRALRALVADLGGPLPRASRVPAEATVSHEQKAARGAARPNVAGCHHPTGRPLGSPQRATQGSRPAAPPRRCAWRGPWDRCSEGGRALPPSGGGSRLCAV